MGAAPGAVYTPIPDNVAAYEELFREYRALHDYFGRGTNDVMHRLKAIQRAAAAESRSALAQSPLVQSPLVQSLDSAAVSA
jgi:L-ribulokinase